MKLDLASGVDIEIRFNYEHWINRNKRWNDKEFMESGQSIPVTVIKIERVEFLM